VNARAGVNARAVLESAAQKLAAAGIAEPYAKAKVMTAHALGIEYSQIAAHGDISPEAQARIEEMTAQCANGVPVEYATGKAYFRHLALNVDERVLIPRQETELVAQCAIDWIQRRGYETVLDMCTGSGCIAISLATETKAQVSAADISEDALELARHNAKLNLAQVRFIQSDMFADVQGKYDLIVSNPPYVSEAEYDALDISVKDYEPQAALAAGDGLDFYRVIANEAVGYIRSGGALVLEIGADQGEDVKTLLNESGFLSIAVHRDYAGRDRIVTADRE